MGGRSLQVLQALILSVAIGLNHGAIHLSDPEAVAAWNAGLPAPSIRRLVLGEPRSRSFRYSQYIPFYRRIAQYTRKLEELESRVASVKSPERFKRCPPLEIQIAGRPGIVTLERGPRFEGSSCAVYVSGAPVDGFAVRVTSITGEHQAMYQGLNEMAFRDVFASDLDGVILASHSPESGTLSEMCELRTIITNFGGSFTLGNFKVHHPGSDIREGIHPMTESMLAAVAVCAIKMVERIHSLGMVHGDIYERNFVVSDPTDPAGSMRLIDFGRTTPFVDPRGMFHVTRATARKDGLEPGVMSSPFEIKGAYLTRRDDMYRISEMLFVLLGETRRDLLVKASGAGGAVRFAEAKLAWESKLASSSVFNKFHAEMATLKPMDAPDYDKWIDRFTSLAAGEL